jgi:anti-sigma B factor antagonist
VRGWTYANRDSTGVVMSDFQSSPQRRAEHIIKLGQLRLRSQRSADTHTITVCGEIDLATVDAVRNELKRAQASDVRRIVIDLAGVTFIDSNGARLLYEAAERSRIDANRLTLRRGPASIMRVLQITGVGDLLPFESDQVQHPRH